ncbi:MAG: NYN domain-containing protein [Desulfovibrio sp.]|nr:NYN domain-containing protein [Desulfovibrio sp.]
MKIRKLVAIDLLPTERRAKEMGFPYFPVQEFIACCAKEHAGEHVDIIEALCTLQLRVPEDDTVEAMAQARQQFEKKRYALEMCGVRVIECPSKRSQNSPSGFKQSDDQRLMIRTLILSMKLRPDFVILVASDGDYTPMVEALRDEGIRTEVVASFPLLANDLRRHAVRVVDLDEVLDKILVRQRSGDARLFCVCGGNPPDDSD